MNGLIHGCAWMCNFKGMFYGMSWCVRLNAYRYTCVHTGRNGWTPSVSVSLRACEGKSQEVWICVTVQRRCCYKGQEGT